MEGKRGPTAGGSSQRSGIREVVMASVPHTLSDTYKSLAPILCLCQELRLPSSLPHRASSIASPSPKSPATTLPGQTCPKATVPPPPSLSSPPSPTHTTQTFCIFLSYPQSPTPTSLLLFRAVQSYFVPTSSPAVPSDPCLPSPSRPTPISWAVGIWPDRLNSVSRACPP